MTEPRIKVAVLGGGVGALVAAFALTEIDPAGETYDITLHQLGWRLGGKTASGRNVKYGQRIEEHGLHIWAGFYENAFTVMRIVFKALNRPPTDPVATLADAFKRQDRIEFAEPVQGQWLPWPFWFRPDTDPTLFPGRDSLWAPPDPMPSLGTQLRRLLAALMKGFQACSPVWSGDQHTEAAIAIALLSAEQRSRLDAARTPGTAHPLLACATLLAEGLESESDFIRELARESVTLLLHAFHGSLKRQANVADWTTDARRALALINLGVCTALGILRNDCLRHGLQVLDKYEFRDFLAQQDAAAADNDLVIGLYEYVFGFAAGSRDRPCLSACSAVQGCFRLLFTYTGAFFFKSTVGMGDTICTPLYQLLRRRGVKFRFFSKITRLQPTEDGRAIGAILLDEQAALAPGVAEYDPLVMVNGTGCWPSVPNWDQVKDGQALEAAGVDFENLYSPQPPPVTRQLLSLGEDFDQVILGISVGALAEICAPLVHENVAWADMIENLATARTQALQLWLDCPLADLGGPYVAQPGVDATSTPMGPIVATCQPPFDTYSDMSQLLPAEAWTVPGPHSIAYFCAVMSDTEAPDDQKLADEKVQADSTGWMTSWLQTIWTRIGNGAAFDWNLLHCDAPAEGPARLDQQFWSANINPSDRYVLSFPGTLRHRLEPGGSGYTNLVLAGDWTKVPDINAGCVEVAAMAGLAAATALSGVPIPIVSGDTLYRRHPAV